MKFKDIPKFENLNNLNVNVFELTRTVLTPIHVNKNYLQPQIDLLLFENHYCLITKLHCLINKNSHMKCVCRRCLTAFSSEDILNQHIDLCQKQQPINISFSWKDRLKFEDYHMKVPVPIRVYADFECINHTVPQPTELHTNTEGALHDREAAVAIAPIDKSKGDPKVLFNSNCSRLLSNFTIWAPIGYEYCSYFGVYCVEWFVNKMLTLENIASNYFDTNLELEITPQEEESFQHSTICWLCEQALRENPLGDDKVRDHDHLTGKYRGAAHNKCNLNCKQKSSSFVPTFFHNFSGYDCHLIFEEFLTQAYKMRYEPNIILKSMENYVGVQVGCLRFLDSYRSLIRSSDKLMKSMQSGANNFPIMTLEGMSDELFKKKLAYPYEYFTHDNFQEPLNLSPEDFWSTLKQTTPPDEEINRTQEIIKKFNVKNGQEFTEMYLKMDVL